MNSTAEAWNDRELQRAATLAKHVRSIVGADSRIFAARAPGRVNLIGEHTDYSGLPVLPIAIDRSTIVVAAANSDREIALSNLDPAWPSRRFPISKNIEPYPTGDWANYVKAAVQGVIDHFATRGHAVDRMLGATMLVDGRVPPAAGLSSSAALTVSAAMAFMAINNLQLDGIDAATMVARSEWYVGTRAGGMDQAASILGRRDHATFIEFEPLRVYPVPIPADAAIIVADSRQIADKSGTVRAEYNRRVVECAIAARILGRALKLDNVRILGDVIRNFERWNSRDLLRVLESNAPARLGADLNEAAAILDESRSALENDVLGVGANRIALDSNRPLEILRRTRHVLSETERVMLAVEALKSGRLREMGDLMNESHRSLAEDFECSTAQLDRLVECARRGGALGARLTGAGFGGSIVALCESSTAARVVDRLRQEYYANLADSLPFEESCAVLHAGDGASTIELAAA
ncbi:MAG: galactokinase [Candidatus Binatus sp.]|uniref:galactokinase n=1 Tax=Candidatus Binatus sp. TaxID=2811406 RepID=UPI002716CA4F|nr:galactokinase [Candidatus Binatus sp.]MDO8432508.1 galactokinase [Candidatus Binatus sp.]